MTINRMTSRSHGIARFEMQWRIALSADRVHIYEGDKLRNWTLAETKEVLSSRLSVQEAERLIEQLQRTGEVQIEIPEA